MGPIANCASRNLRWVPALPPDITHLYLENNRIAEINATSLSGLERLKELDLGHQYSSLVIRNEAFRRQKHLRRLVLGFNVRLRLEPQAFVGLSGLQVLNLDYCSLQESILEDRYLEPLASLEVLDLFGNQIKRLQPAWFFANMTRLKIVNLKLNKIDRICESDLLGFRGKHLLLLNLDSNRLAAMFGGSFDWQTCGNPFRGMSFDTLDLSYNGFTAVTSNALFETVAGTKISHLKLSGPMGKGFSFDNLPDPDMSTFRGLRNSSVLSLDLSRNRIYALQQGVFSPLKDAALIDISHNTLNRIHENAFEGLEGRLQMLNLSHNLLGELYSYHFAFLTNLRVLDLSYNHIGALGFGSFRGLPRLKALFLTGNSLRVLGVPAALPSLDHLQLSDNRLTSSSVSRITQFAPNITHLNLESNRLTNLGDVYTFVTRLKRLQHLFFGGNPTSWCTVAGRVSEIGSNHLQTLHLHSSNLQYMWSQGRCLNLFDHLGRLAGLNISYNGLRFLPPGIFRGLTSVEELDLSSNTLTYLQPDAFPQSLKRLHLSSNFIVSPDPTCFRSLRVLDLKMNRFHCDPSLKSFLTWLNNTNVTFLSPVEELRCEFPSELYDVSLLDYATRIKQQ